MTRAAHAPGSASLSRTAAALRAVTRRARIHRALHAASALATVAVGIALLAGLIDHFGYALPARSIALLALTLPVIGALAGALRPVGWLPMARALDRALKTPDLLSSALAFAALPSAQQTPFMRGCVAQAEAAIAALSQQKLAIAAPWRAPRSLAALCALSAAFLMLTHAEALGPKAAPPALSARAPVVSADTLAAFAEEAHDVLEARALDPEAREVARALNALLQALADGKIDRAQALQELRKLEERQQAALAEDPKALQDALEKMARAMAGSPDAKPLQEALSEKWPEAPAAAERMAAKLEAKAMSEGAAQKLAASLKKAASQQSAGEKASAIEAAKRELERLTREAESSSSGKSDAQRDRQDRLLKRKQRELDQLEREREKSERADRALDKLKRDLDQAGESLEKRDQKSAAQHMRDAASSMRSAAERENARKQAERLAEQLAQLRSEIAQAKREGSAGENGEGQGQQQSQGENGATRLSRERFAQLARGEQGASSEGNQPSQSGESVQAQLGKPKPGGAPNGSPNGPGQGKPNGVVMMPGQNGSPAQGEGAPIPGLNSSSASAAVAESARGGREAGQGGKPGLGAATEASGQHVDTRVAGEKRSGPSRSEIILESGQRGFASEDYARVHGDYERHAESVLEQEHIPGGYRFYVRRYFQMIRPRPASTGQ